MGTYGMSGPVFNQMVRHQVVLGGREVPHLEAWKDAGDPGKVWVSVPHHILDIPADDADRTIRFIADAIAVGMGYTCHPSADMEPVLQTPFPRVHMITSMRTEDDLLRDLDPDNDSDNDTGEMP